MIITFPLCDEKICDLKTAKDFLRKGDIGKASLMYDQIILWCIESQKHEDLIAPLLGRLTCYKHLFYQSNNDLYAILIKKHVETMEELWKTCKLGKVHFLHFSKGSCAVFFKNYPEAENQFNQALKLCPPDHKGKANYKVHLGEAMYLNGKKDAGKETLLEGVREIKALKDPFLLNHWTSGSYIRLVKLLYSDGDQSYDKYLKKAEKILYTDEQMVARRTQLQPFLNALPTESAS